MSELRTFILTNEDFVEVSEGIISVNNTKYNVAGLDVKDRTKVLAKVKELMGYDDSVKVIGEFYQGCISNYEVKVIPLNKTSSRAFVVISENKTLTYDISVPFSNIEGVLNEVEKKINKVDEDYSNMTKRERKLMLAGEFIGAFIDTSARLGCTIAKCQEALNKNPKDKEAQSTLDNVLKTKENIKNYGTLKDDPSYEALFKKYGIDKYYETLIRLLEEVN